MAKEDYFFGAEAAGAAAFLVASVFALAGALALAAGALALAAGALAAFIGAPACEAAPALKATAAKAETIRVETVLFMRFLWRLCCGLRARCNARSRPALWMRVLHCPALRDLRTNPPSSTLTPECSIR